MGKRKNPTEDEHLLSVGEIEEKVEKEHSKENKNLGAEEGERKEAERELKENVSALEKRFSTKIEFI